MVVRGFDQGGCEDGGGAGETERAQEVFALALEKGGGHPEAGNRADDDRLKCPKTDGQGDEEQDLQRLIDDLREPGQDARHHHDQRRLKRAPRIELTSSYTSERKSAAPIARQTNEWECLGVAISMANSVLTTVSAIESTDARQPRLSTKRRRSP